MWDDRELSTRQMWFMLIRCRCSSICSATCSRRHIDSSLFDSHKWNKFWKDGRISFINDLKYVKKKYIFIFLSEKKRSISKTCDNSKPCTIRSFRPYPRNDNFFSGTEINLHTREKNWEIWWNGGWRNVTLKYALSVRRKRQNGFHMRRA